MRRERDGGEGLRFGRRVLWLALAAWLLLPAPVGQAADVPQPMDSAMSSAGWLQQVYIKLENEAASDVGMLPDTPGAIEREWRTFARDGSPLGALVNVGWVALLACVALLAETGVSRGLTRRLRRKLRLGDEAPSVAGLLRLVLCDVIGLIVFFAVFIHGRHWLTTAGAPITLVIFASNVLIRWRIAAVIVDVLLRPHDPPARLLDLPDREAKHLGRFLSATILAIIVLIGFGRYGLRDEDSGAPHVVALLVAVAVCGLYALIVFYARSVAEGLIRGASGGLVGTLRAAVARAWLAIGMIMVAALFVFFVFGLSLGLLSYYHAVISTLGVILVVLVLERLTDRGWRQSRPEGLAAGNQDDHLLAQGSRRILRAAMLLLAAITLTWVWADAIELTQAAANRAIQAAIAAALTGLVAYVAWELIRLAIDRHLQSMSAGPKLPGDDDAEGGPGSRLQTVLPMVRIMIGALLAVVATLVVLSRLGIDTAPLIAGAGVFGLAVSFGAQSLVRDIISGLFYMWDDAFRIGEYIDTGRLKGTVEALGIRSVKVRHHNGPLHTIPYGQLGAVTNQSRDFATIKFNLRLERDVDIELVRRTAKRIGLDMQDEPEMASEVILPLKMQGIAEVADTALVVRFKFTARPIKPSWVQREYVKRMYGVFSEKGIVFASGALTLQTVSARPGTFAGGPEAALPAFAEVVAATRVA
jgi:small-conductance mechanosensitive channel